MITCFMTIHKIMIVVGTRPEIIKMSPLINEIKARKYELQLIHTGQHYDKTLSEDIFHCLSIVEPEDNLSVGSEDTVSQIARIMVKFDLIINNYEPDIVLAQGDTNTVLAVALTCAKKGVIFGHLEAGLRSDDLTLPEEINRRVAAIVTHFHFAPSKRAILNLLRENIDPERIFLTGNTIVDVLKQNKELIENCHTPKLKDIVRFLGNEPFILWTLHRNVNVDHEENLKEVVKVLEKLSDKKMKVIFSLHPRTEKMLEEFQLMSKLENLKNVLITPPLSFLEFLNLLKKCSLIVSDSGGIQEEIVTLKKKMVTIRNTTERPESVEMGLNILTEIKCEKIFEAIEEQLQKNIEQLEFPSNPYGEGTAAKTILDTIEKKGKKMGFKAPSLLEKGLKEYKLQVVEKEEKVSEVEKEKKEITLAFNEKGIPIAFDKNTTLKRGYHVIIKE